MQLARQSSNGPVRSCVGCAARRAKQELVRFTLKDGVLYPDCMVSGRGSGAGEGDGADESNRAGEGRGAYLCYSKECFFKALRKNAFSRAFKTQVRLTGYGVSRAEERPPSGAEPVKVKEAAYEGLWQGVSGKLSKAGKIKEVKLKG